MVDRACAVGTGGLLAGGYRIGPACGHRLARLCELLQAPNPHNQQTNYAPVSNPLQLRAEQMKKYSTANAGPINGMFMLMCMLAALTSLRVGWPPCQL